MTDLKTLNLNLETNLHRQQNKKNQQTKQLAISRQSTGRTDQDRERKENKKEQKMKEIKKKKYDMHVNRHSQNQRMQLREKYLYYRQSKQTNK